MQRDWVGDRVKEQKKEKLCIRDNSGRGTGRTSENIRVMDIVTNRISSTSHFMNKLFTYGRIV